MSWTIDQARGAGEVPAEDRRAVALYGALPSRPGESWFLSACAHAALVGLADRAGSSLLATEAASEAETVVARLHQAVAMATATPTTTVTRTPGTYSATSMTSGCR